MSTQDWLSRLKGSPLFASLGVGSLEQLVQELRVVHLPGGDTLVRQGDPGDALYVLLSGRLRVRIAGTDRKAQVVREIRPGETIGELSLLTGEPRSATVYATRDSELVRLSREAFDRLCAQHPSAMITLARQMAMRLLSPPGDPARGEPRCTVAVLPLSKGVPHQEFLVYLMAALSAEGNARWLSHGDVDAALGQGTTHSLEKPAAAGKVLHWLSEQEAAHHALIYEGDSAAPDWTELCLRQADRILLLVSGDERCETVVQEATGPARRFLSGGAHPTTRTELVVVHQPSTAQPTGTDEWLRTIQVDGCYHVTLGTRGDYARLVRFLLGRVTGLVLGGGGARGFAYIGVIRALREAEVPLDALGGTSMGAMIAAQFAMGMDYEAMLDANRRCWIERDPLKNYTLPLLSTTSGTQIKENLNDIFGSRLIEDLPIRYFCVSTDLARADLVIHQRGSLWKSVRASMSIPGIAPPLFWNGQMLVDGGLLNNLPVDVMKDLYGARVIGVEVSPKEAFECDVDAESVSGWRLLWERLGSSSARRRMPRLLDVLIRATMVHSVRHAEASRVQCALYLSPPVEQFGLFEWAGLPKMAEIGYRHTCDLLERVSKAPPGIT